MQGFDLSALSLFPPCGPPSVGPARERGPLAEGLSRPCPVSLPQDHAPGNRVRLLQAPLSAPQEPSGGLGSWAWDQGQVGLSLSLLNHQVLSPVRVFWNLECHLPFAQPPLALHSRKSTQPLPPPPPPSQALLLCVRQLMGAQSETDGSCLPPPHAVWEQLLPVHRLEPVCLPPLLRPLSARCGRGTMVWR